MTKLMGGIIAAAMSQLRRASARLKTDDQSDRERIELSEGINLKASKSQISQLKRIFA